MMRMYPHFVGCGRCYETECTKVVVGIGNQGVQDQWGSPRLRVLVIVIVRECQVPRV